MVEAETGLPAKLKCLLSGPLQEKFADPDLEHGSTFISGLFQDLPHLYENVNHFFRTAIC